MDPSVTLWQFLLHLLEEESSRHLITWTSSTGEFKLLDAEQVARLWGLRKNKTNMNYDKLSRALRYYYEKNIIKKVSGQKFVYRFVSFPDTGPCEGPGTPQPPWAPGEGLLRLRRGGWGSRSSRSDYMWSGLYSSFTIQSLGRQAGATEAGATGQGSQVVVVLGPTPETGAEGQESEVVVVLEPTPEAGAEGQGSEVEVVLEPTPEAGAEGQGSEVVVVLEPTPEAGAEGQGSEVVVALEPTPEAREVTEPVILEELGAGEGDRAQVSAMPLNQKSRKAQGLGAGPLPQQVSPRHGGQLPPAPRLGTTQAPTVLAGHSLTPMLLPSTIHFWSTLSPLAPQSPAKLFQFPSAASGQTPVPGPIADGLSTPVLLSPGIQKP